MYPMYPIPELSASLPPQIIVAITIATPTLANNTKSKQPAILVPILSKLTHCVAELS